MTWGMYERSTRPARRWTPTTRSTSSCSGPGQGLRGGTDISQFTKFETAEDEPLRARRRPALGADRPRQKPVIAQIQGFAVGGSFGIAAGADIRIATPDAVSARPSPAPSTTASRCGRTPISSALAPQGLILTPWLGRRGAGRRFVHEVVPADRIEARVREWLTVARMRPSRLGHQGSDPALQRCAPCPTATTIATTYGSADFHEACALLKAPAARRSACRADRHVAAVAPPAPTRGENTRVGGKDRLARTSPRAAAASKGAGRPQPRGIPRCSEPMTRRDMRWLERSRASSRPRPTRAGPP